MKDNFDVAAYVAARQQMINEALAAELDKAAQAAPPGEGTERLLEAMRYSLLAGGKRLRPLLLLATVESIGQKREDELAGYLPFACGLEMLHTYSLIHDDLPAMDDDDLRRGRPSCHKAFDEATAILAGDALLTHCFFCLLSTPGSSAVQVLQAAQYFAWKAGLGGMVSGQVLDLAAEGQPLELPELRKIHANKTGALLEAAVVCGGRLVGSSGPQQLALQGFGRQFGIAFQIADDILDVVGDESKLGKPIGSDAENDKVTYVSLLGLAGAQEAADKAMTAAQNALLLLGEQGWLLAALADYFCQRDN